MTENRFWNFVPATGTKPPEMLLYGPIASQRSWWEDRVTPAQFNQELAAIGDVEELVVRINSPGGDVFAAHAIYCRLRDLSAKITVKIDGWAASAATIVAMAGDVIQIPRNGVFMIHDPAMTVSLPSFTREGGRPSLTVRFNSLAHHKASLSPVFSSKIAEGWAYFFLPPPNPAGLSGAQFRPTIRGSVM